jgi:hypothetical protein
MTIETDDKIKRSEAAWKRQSNWHSLYRDAYKYGMPQRNGFDQVAEGQSKGALEVFDSTAVVSVPRFASRLQDNMCPAFQRWCKFEAGPLVPEAQKTKVNKILQMVEERFFAVLDGCNFNTAFHEFGQDLCAGTAVMLVEEDVGKARSSIVRCTAISQDEIAIEEGPHGSVQGFYQRPKVAVRNIEQTWPDAVLPASLAEKKAQADTAGEEVQLDVCVYYDPDKDCYEYDVIFVPEKVSILRKPRKYYECPYICVRWMKASNEVHGRGPLLQALPDIKTLNKLIELTLKNASLAVSGVYTGVNDGAFNPNTVKIVPGAVIPVGSNGGVRGPSLQPLKSSADFNVEQLVAEELRMSIKKMLLDNTLPPDTGPVRSPTEIAARLKELASDIGAAFGRLMVEFIQPFVQRVLGIMSRNGMLADIGEVKITGSLVALKVTSPLARLQNSQDVEAVLNWLAMIGQLGPELVALGVKVEDLPEWFGQKLGVDATLIREQDEKAVLQQKVTEMIAQQVAAQQQEQQPRTQAKPAPQSTPMKRAA